MQPKMQADMNSLEDYWEDASVSLGCSPNHSWGLSFPSTLHSKDHHILESKGTVDLPLHVPSAPRPRTFPPPLALCATLSIKEGGRFVLKEMASLPPQAFFRAERQHGRLRLHFIDGEELDKEDDTDDGNLCSPRDLSVCADSDLHTRKDGYKTFCAENIIASSRIAKNEIFDTIQGVNHEHVCIKVENHAMKQIEAENSSIGGRLQGNISTDVESSTLEEHGVEHIEYESSSIEGCVRVGALGSSKDQRTSQWSVEVSSNDNAASISPRSFKQMRLHQSFATTGPALGLAVS